MLVCDMQINWWLPKPLVRVVWELREHPKKGQRMTKSKVRLVGEAAWTFKVPYMLTRSTQPHILTYMLVPYVISTLYQLLEEYK